MRWIPLTRVVTGHSPPRLGDLVTATSGPFATRGAPGFVDRMRIDRLDPPTATTPGVATFTKLGPILRGTAELQVTHVDGTHARVTWSEDVTVAGPLPRRAVDLVLAPFLRGMLRLALARLDREVRHPAQQIAAPGPIDATDHARTRNAR